MTNLDALLAAGQALTTTHTAVDRLIDGGLCYGPGMLLTAVGATAWYSGRRIAEHVRNRADKRRYAARAVRLHKVADRADAILTMPEYLVTARLEDHYATAPNHAQEEGR
ncbi:hypothetical protein ABZ438_07785 [Streptomyces sp. NPDC005786]|uniref:hypothetical protein n=1 Tax=Streptomyces sp. NPDC005786 TaxID=3154891 RepID=UPI0033F97467